MIDSRTTAVALCGGLGYAVLLLWAQALVRGQSLSSSISPAGLGGWLVFTYVCLGLVVLGGVPVALYYRRRLLAPLGGLVVLSAWAVYRSWQSLAHARAIGADPGVSLRPDSALALFWFVPLGVLLLFALVEYKARTATDGIATAFRSR